jgi:hypothetical protein
MNKVRKHVIITATAVLLALVYLLQLPGGAFHIISPVGSPEIQGPPSFEHWEQANTR